MRDSEINGHTQNSGGDDPKAVIRALNDRLRLTGRGGRWLFTSGVAALDGEQQRSLIRSVQSYSDFDVKNDPHQEHDFGAIKIADQQFF